MIERILRYNDDLGFTSPRDSLSDIVDQLQFCTSPQYASDLLGSRHNVPAVEARKRGVRLAAHVTTALSFVEQTLRSATDVAAVPAYYAALNLAKCYILASSRHSALNSKLQHGISYKTYGKGSQHLLTEEIVLQKSGVLATLYEVLTGEALTTRTLSVRDFYPFIADIGTEWELAAGTSLRLHPVQFEMRANKQGVRVPHARVAMKESMSVRSIPVLRTFQKLPKASGEFLGQPDSSGDSDSEVIRKQIRPFLLYDAHPGYTLTPVSAARIKYPQEIPIILAFFHLSSVSRYNPELLARIKSSRFWPLIVTARWHALQKFCILAWSYLQQRNVLANARPWEFVPLVPGTP